MEGYSVKKVERILFKKMLKEKRTWWRWEHHDRDIDHSIVVLYFARHLPQFLNTLNWGNLSCHDKRQYTESVAPRQFSAHLWVTLCAKLPTRFTKLRSRLVRNYHFASFRVRFSIRALPSIPEFIISFLFHHSSSFSDSISFQNIARVIHRATVIWQILSCSIVGLVLRPSHVRNTLELCMAVAHVLFVDDESRGDSIFQFACFLFHVIELSFHKFFVFSTTFFFIFDTDHWIFEVQKQKEWKHDVFKVSVKFWNFFVILLLLLSILFEKECYFWKRFCSTKMKKCFWIFFRESENMFLISKNFFERRRSLCAIESSPDHCRVRWRCWASEVYMRWVVTDLVRGTSVASRRLFFFEKSKTQ